MPKPSPSLTMKPLPGLHTKTVKSAPSLARLTPPSKKLAPNTTRVFEFWPYGVRFPMVMASSSRSSVSSAPMRSSSPLIESHVGSDPVGSDPVGFRKSPSKLESIEEVIEKVIYSCRFVAFLGVLGSLVGSLLCFLKGCTYVVQSFTEYIVNRGKVILLLVEAIDIYLLGTVMLVFGMGLYELFVSNINAANSQSEEKIPYRSNLFGLFTLKERPKWLDIKTVNELKTKLGHVIVMLLLIGFFEKSKIATIQSPVDLLCFSASVLLCSGCLFLLSKLTN